MTSIGRYQIVQKLGQGGMGAVYEAFDPQIQRTVAIKVISAHTVDRPDLRDRFFREARAAGQLTHKNIITIYDLGEHEGQPYIAMEYLEGTDLDKHMRQGGPLSLAQKLDIVSEIAEGLAYAHDRGIIHRDIKPANVMLAAGDRVKILDFGLARVVSSDLTRSNMVFGTMEYMAPEQIRAEPVDHRADIFSVGALFYELLSGRRPFQGDTFAATMYKILQELPPPLRELGPDLPPHVCAIVERALAKSRTDRFQTMSEMLRALRLARQSAGSSAIEVSAYAGGGASPPPLTPPDAPTFVAEAGSGGDPGVTMPRPLSATPPPATPPPATALSRPGLGRRAWVGGVVVGVLLLAFGGYWLARGRPSPPSNDDIATSAAVEPQTVPPVPVSPPPGNGPGTPPSPEAGGRAVPPPAPPAEPKPPEAPEPERPRADPALRRGAELALRQMTAARKEAESVKAADLVPDGFEAAVAREQQARRLHTRGEYLQSQAGFHDARAQFLVAAAEARRLSAAADARAREESARKAAAQRLTTAQGDWDRVRQAAESAGAKGPAFEQAMTRATAARQAADRGDVSAAITGFEEASRLAAQARDEAEAARKAAAAPKPAAPRPAPAADPAVAARREIQTLVERYVGALQAHDLEALKHVWPSLEGAQERAIRDEFDNASAIEVSMASPRIELAGDTARVTATRNYQILTRDGQRLQSETRTVLQVRRVNGQWIIESIRYEALQ